MFSRFKLRGLRKENLEEKVRLLEAQIYELEGNLIHDKLTGLKTRAFFEEEVSMFLNIISQQFHLEQYASVQRKERFGFRNLSLIFLDVDHFKKINDAYGHDTGDIVLKRIAKTIQNGVRTGDTVARWGGEEIVVSLLGANETDAALKAEEIRRSVEKLKFPKLPKLKVTVSAGVTTSLANSTLEELVKKADTALYKAKEEGRNRVVTYSTLN